ncbi:MAG: hypothetical protein AB1439_05600 [candidate division FCPU426 bacterium]
MKTSWGWALLLFGTAAFCGPRLVQAGFELEKPGARSAGMAGAFCALADDTDALFSNPAGMAQIPTPMAGLSYGRLLAGLNDGVLSEGRISYIQPLEDYGSIGASWFQRSLQDMYQENLWALGYGLALDETGSYMAGIALKLLQQRYLDSAATAANPYFDGGTSALAVGVDVGGLMYLTDEITAGLSLANVNQPNLSLSGAESRVPFQLRAGAGWRQENYLAGFEALTQSGHYRLALGGEAWWVRGIFASRLGLALGDRELSEATAGFTLRLPQTAWSVGVEYALVIPLGGFSEAGVTHLLNLQFTFGASQSAEDDARALADRLIEEGEDYRREGDAQAALQAWEEAAEMVPDDQTLRQKITALNETLKRQAEIRIHIDQGLEFEKEGNLLSAASEYRKAQTLDPRHSQASLLLQSVQKKLEVLSEQQKQQQERKEREAALVARRAALREAGSSLQRARAAFSAARKNRRVREYFDEELSALQKQLALAEENLSVGESERVQAISQAVSREAERLAVRAVRREKAEAEEVKAPPAPAPEKSRDSAPVPAVTPAPEKATLTAPLDARVQRLRKRARGAYGRAVKLMLDIDTLNGERYFPKQVAELKQELGKIKLLLRSEDYATTVASAEKLFPTLQALKAECADKDKARKAMPTNW